ncbi:hypothetical protein [Mesomycoplasma ovipneumoniae]|uniref:hypothetical protein n=1 Tax=Mesomycoplasma ovipneumoniae TaxID=29562 RepID=UPI00083E928F|nr:hypothetical protein [Mesomycoplasma ovipneumoniae]
MNLKEKLIKKARFILAELEYWNKTLPTGKKLKESLFFSYISNFGESDYKDIKPKASIDSLAEFLARNKEAYYHFATKDMFGNIHQVLRYFLLHEKKEPYSLAETLLKKSPSGMAAEIRRLTEEERRKWIVEIGKNDCSFDGLCDGVYSTLSEEEKIKDLEEETKRWNLIKKSEDLEVEESRLWVHEYKKSKILESQFKHISFGLDRMSIFNKSYLKDSIEVLEKLFILNKKVYRTMPQTSYEIFSMHEAKSNFNLIDNLITKYWTNYPEIHNTDQKTRYKAISKFANDIKSGKIHEPEVELLGFGKSQKQDLNQTQTNKFEQPKLKM